MLASVRSRGVRLWSENGQLHYKGPKDALTRDEIGQLRASRDRIVALLESSRTAGNAASRAGRNRFPLAFSQLARWNQYQHGERRPMRTITSATHLHGPLNVDVLRRSLAAIICRHDALRIHIVACEGTPVQEVAESGYCELEAVDLSISSERGCELEVNRRIEQLVLEPVDLAAGGLLRVQLLRLNRDEHVLVVAMEHMISDMYSMGILLRELFTAYSQLASGRELSLPKIAIQFADYAARQRSTETLWTRQHDAYWNEHLAGCERLRFPKDRSISEPMQLGWGSVPLCIDGELKAALQQWCRANRTTLPMSVLAAYVAVVLRWCNCAETVIQHQSDGRTDPAVENTIGFFASVLHLRIALHAHDTFADLTGRVTHEYCRAYEHADLSRIAARMPPPAFTRNSVFNWIPQDTKIDVTGPTGAGPTVAWTSAPFAHLRADTTEMDHEPSVLLLDGGEEIAGWVYFPLHRFSVSTMEQFARNFLAFVAAVPMRTMQPVRELPLA
ncbi:MAG: condensation domain-containing protein [Steroidobacteraceae bacterium]